MPEKFFCFDGSRGTVVGSHRLHRMPARPGLRSHAGAWARSKPWCARRTLPAIMRKRLFVRRVRRAHHLFAGHRPPRCHPSRPRLMGSRRGRSPDQIIEIPFLSRAWPAPTTAAVLVGGGPCPRWQERQGHWRPPATEGGAPPTGGVTKNVTRGTTGVGDGHGHWWWQRDGLRDSACGGASDGKNAVEAGREGGAGRSG